MAKVSVIIVSWNASSVIGNCLASLRAQTWQDFGVTVVDNASSDGTAELVRRDLPGTTVLRNPQNVGFARANNQGIALSHGEYVLTLNPDVELGPTCLQQLVKFADAHPQGGAFGGKLLKRSAADATPAIIDSTGLRVTRSRRVLDRGEGEPDSGRYDVVEQVFGFSGACALYRRSALTDAAQDGRVFDEFFFAYKEDVDLAWRLRLLGWEAWYVPMAVAVHPRGLGRRNGSLAARLGQRRQRSRTLRLLSWRNHRALLLKNEQLPNALVHAVPLGLRELAALAYAIVAEPFQLRGLLQLAGHLPQLLRQRRTLLRRRRVTAREMRRWLR